MPKPTKYPSKKRALEYVLDNLNIPEQNQIFEILQRGFHSSDLDYLRLDASKSRIIQRNFGKLYFAKYSDLKGLFRKDITATAMFGRIVCDFIIHTLNNDGFFTSDELPAYGISFKERRIILSTSKADQMDLVAFFVYDYSMSYQTKLLLDEILKEIELYAKSRP